MSSVNEPDKEGSKTDRPESATSESQKAAEQSSITEVDVLHTFVQEYKTRDDQNSRLQKRNFWLGVTTAVLLFAYTTITALQWSATRDAVEVTRRSVEISQRAWLIATEFVQFSQPLTKEDKRVSVPLIVENSGKTPAIYIQGGVNTLCTRTPQEPFNWPQIAAALKSIPTSQSVLGPGEKSGLIVVDLPLPSGCQMGQVLTDQISLLIYGYVNYWDEFGTLRGLLVCGVYVPNDRRFQFCGHDNLPW